MDIVATYKCLCDELRLRILNLLRPGPLCVCHLVEILDCDSIKMSKQLRYMKELGILAAERQAQWMIYRLAQPDHCLLEANMQCLLDCASEELGFAADLRQREALIARLQAEDSPCAKTLLAENQTFST